MSGRDLRSGIRTTGGDRQRNCGDQTGAGRIARLKAVPLAARAGVKRAVSLDLEQCHGTGGVLVMPAKSQLPLRSSARRRLDRHAPV